MERDKPTREQFTQTMREWLANLRAVHNGQNGDGEHLERLQEIEKELAEGYTLVPEELRNGKE